MLVAGLLVQHGMLGCWRTSMGCWFAGLAWDAGLLADQHGILVFWRTSMGFWDVGFLVD